MNRRAGVSSEVVDIASVPLPIDDAGEAIKDPTFSATMNAADGLVIVGILITSSRFSISRWSSSGAYIRS